MPRETCTIYVSHRDMDELMRAFNYMSFHTYPIHSAGYADPRQTLWGFPIVVSEAAVRPFMVMRWGDMAHHHQMSVQDLLEPSILDRVARELDEAAADTARRHRLERQLNNFEDYARAVHDHRVSEIEYEMARRATNEMLRLAQQGRLYQTHLDAAFKNPADFAMRPVTNRRSFVRSIIIEKET